MNEIIERIIDASLLNEASALVPTTDYENGSGIASKALTDFVTSELDEPRNNDVVKIMAAAMQIASESGVLEVPAASPLQTAITAANIAQELNLSYLLEQGQIMAEEAADALVDQATASALLVAEVALSPKTLEMGMNTALDAVSAAYPPITPATQFAKQFTAPIASFISEKVRPVVHRGIQTVSRVAKEVSHGVISKVTSAVKSIGSKVVNKILSIF